MKEKVRKKKIKPYYFLIAFLCITILMLIVIAPANAGVSPDTGRSVGDNEFAIIGETNMSFVNATDDEIHNGTIQCTGVDIIACIYFDGPFDSSHYEDELALGNCKVRGPSGYGEISVYFSPPKLDVTTVVCEENFDWITRGGNITFKAITNLWVIHGSLPNYINYKLLDPYGVPLDDVNGVPLTNIDVSGSDITSLTINTTGMRTGFYTLSIETDPDTNNGLDREGQKKTFEVKREGVTIEVSKEKQTVTKEVVFTVSTTPNTNISLNVTRGRKSKVKFYGVSPPLFGKSDKDGKFIAEASFTDTGSYELTATEFIVNTADSITVEIVEFEAELIEPKEGVHHIGENIKITGSANAGDSVTIKIDDEVVATGEPIEGFSYTWKTGDKSPGSHEVGIWVLPLSDPFTDPPDDSVSILLMRGGLSAKLIYTDTEEKEIVQEIVAQGDDFEIKGKAQGRDNVDILTIAPKGGSGSGFDPTDIFEETNGTLNVPGLTYSTSPVLGDKFEFNKKIDVGKDVDTGTYLVVALNPGRDEVYGSGVVDILTVITGYDFSIKTQAQILAILKEETINQAGSDDLLWVGTIEVENPWVTLNDIEDVHLGDEIVVSGVSNRRNNFPFLITVEGPTDLTPQFVYNDVSKKDTFSTDKTPFSTVSAKVGKYTVTVNDGDGYRDTKTVNILPATTPSFNISSMPTPIPAPAAIIHEGEGTNESDTAAQVATPIPTRTATSTKTEEKKKSDFVLIFIIAAAGAGLLMAVSVARLKIRKRREQGEVEEEEEEEKQGEDGTV